jgi:hypothetical protein
MFCIDSTLMFRKAISESKTCFLQSVENCVVHKFIIDLEQESGNLNQLNEECAELLKVTLSL